MMWSTRSQHAKIVRQAVTCSVWLWMGLCPWAYAQKRSIAPQDISQKASSFLSQPKRIEFEIKPEDGDFAVISAQEKGLLVAKATQNRQDEGYIWQLYRLDTTLHTVWKKDIVVDYGWSFSGYDYGVAGFFLLFNTSEYDPEEMHVVHLDLVTGKAAGYEIKLPLPLALSEFEVIEKTLIFAGYAKHKPVIALISLSEPDKVRVMPGIYNKDSRLLSLQTDNATNNFTVILSEKNQQTQASITLKTFTQDGQLVHTETLQSDEKRNLLDAVSTHFEHGTQYVAGTFAERKSDYSTGLYLAKLELGYQQFIKYYDYVDLENFFSYLSDKRESKIKNKIARQKIKGRKTEFHYRLLINRIIESKDEYILIGEAYYKKSSSQPSGIITPHYNLNRTLYNLPPDPLNSYTSTPSFAKYQYTHAVVVGFSKTGEVLWDNSFEINDLLSDKHQSHVQSAVDQSRIALLYLYEDEIHSKVIKNNETVAEKSTAPISLQFESDELRSSDRDTERLAKWYGHHFYAYGEQHIKNKKDKETKPYRHVFYINKIQYRTTTPEQKKGNVPLNENLIPRRRK